MSKPRKFVCTEYRTTSYLSLQQQQKSYQIEQPLQRTSTSLMVVFRLCTVKRQPYNEEQSSYFFYSFLTTMTLTQKWRPCRVRPGMNSLSCHQNMRLSHLNDLHHSFKYDQTHLHHMPFHSGKCFPPIAICVSVCVCVCVFFVISILLYFASSC